MKVVSVGTGIPLRGALQLLRHQARFEVLSLHSVWLLFQHCSTKEDFQGLPSLLEELLHVVSWGSWKSGNVRQTAGWKKGTSLVRDWVNHRSWLKALSRCSSGGSFSWSLSWWDVRGLWRLALRLRSQVDEETAAIDRVRAHGSGKKTTNQEHICLKMILFPYEMHTED